MLLLVLACDTGDVLSAKALPSSSNQSDSESWADPKDDTAPADDCGDGSCTFDPGDGWTISATTASLDFTHRGVTDFTMTDGGARVGAGPIDSGVIGAGNLYTDGRLGVGTNYWMKQASGDGATISVGTANDRFAFYAENESGDNNSVESVSVYAASVTPRTNPRTNVAAWFSAANAPAGNIGLRVDAQYAPDASPPNQTVVLREMSGDTPLYVAYLNPTYLDAHDAAYAVSAFDIRINGTPVASFTGSGVYASDYQVWSSRELKSEVTPLSAADRREVAEAVKKLEVVRFRYTDDAGNRPHVGLIAEDAPREMVDAERRAVRLPETVAYLVASNQELASENRRLRSDLDALRRDVQALQAARR